MNTAGFGKADKGLDNQMVESVMSLTTLCQFLCIIALSSLPMSEKGVTMGRMLVSVCGVRWDDRCKKNFLLLLLICIYTINKHNISR